MFKISNETGFPVVTSLFVVVCPFGLFFFILHAIIQELNEDQKFLVCYPEGGRQIHRGRTCIPTLYVWNDEGKRQ